MIDRKFFIFAKKKFLNYSFGEIGNVDSKTVVVTFNREVSAADFKAGVTIKVDGNSVSIASGTRQTDKKVVYYVLSNPIIYNNFVTWEYNKNLGNIEDYLLGTPLPDVTAKNITNNLWSPRLSMWVWAYDLKTKANIDAMISWATGRMTDIYVFVIDDSGTPYSWLGSATLGRSNPTIIDGKTPWKYMYDLAHAAGIRVQAWFWMSSFGYIGGANGLDPNIPDNATYNDGGIWNYHDATARAKIIEELADFVANNDLDGINFDCEATTANITAQDLTDTMTGIRAAFPNLELTFCTGGRRDNDITLKFSTKDWIDNNLIDSVVIMGYYEENQEKKIYTESLDLPPRHLTVGVGSESDYSKASDMRYSWLSLIADGYTDFAIFCWGSSIRDDTEIKDVIDAYLSNTLSAVQKPITALSSISGVSFSLTIDGVAQNINFADVATHLYSGPLKQHIEDLYGENPAIIYYRYNSTATRICIGGWEP